MRLVHLEALEEEWLEISDALCRGYNFCSRVPPLPVLNTNFNLWHTFELHRDMQQMLAQMFDEDFHTFGYSLSYEYKMPKVQGHVVHYF